MKLVRYAIEGRTLRVIWLQALLYKADLVWQFGLPDFMGYNVRRQYINLWKEESKMIISLIKKQEN